MISRPSHNAAPLGYAAPSGPLAALLGGRRVLLAGDGAALAGLADLLAAGGCDLVVVSTENATFADERNARLAVQPRRWQERDFAGAALAVGAFADGAEAVAFAAAARRHGVPSSLDGRPELGDLVLNSAIAPAVDAALPAAGDAARGGSVTLVGAGPGDPDLLTLKAVRALATADVILHDDLVSPGVLALARPEATLLPVGKQGYGPSVKQGDINAQLVALAAQGRRVVRLKGGDPGIFGRAGEEIEACRDAGIPVAIVPGISAAQGAAAALGLSLTHRDHARRLQFVTGHGRDGGLPRDIDWAALADPAATTALYMGRNTLPDFREKALQAGLAPETPAVAVIAATTAGEMHLVTTIDDLPTRLCTLPGRGPLLVLIGWAMGSPTSAAQDDRAENG